MAKVAPSTAVPSNLTVNHAVPSGAVCIVPDVTGLPAEMVAWVATVKLAPAHQASLLALLCGDEYGLTVPSDFGRWH